MSTGLEWTGLSENRSTVRYKIVAVGDRDSLSLSLVFFFIFLFFFNIICMYIYINVFSFYQHISRTRFETTIWGLVKYCRVRDGYFEGRSEYDKESISRRVKNWLFCHRNLYISRYRGPMTVRQFGTSMTWSGSIRP